MSGRNQSWRKFGGKGGRGFKNKKNDDRQNESTKKTLAGFTFYVGISKQASHYENTALFVINHIKKDFDRSKNISEALRKLEYKNTDNWNPILKASTSSDEYVKGREYRQSELQFKAEYGESQIRKMFYQQNQHKAYGIIW